MINIYLVGRIYKSYYSYLTCPVDIPIQNVRNEMLLLENEFYDKKKSENKILSDMHKGINVTYLPSQIKY